MKYPSRVVMSSEEYHAHEAVGSSGLRTIIQSSPLHYLWNLKHPSESTPAMKLGTLIHESILEPDKFKAAIVSPDFGDLRSSKNREAKESWLQDNHGKTILKADEHMQIEGILASLSIHNTALSYLSAGKAEDSLFWIDPETKIPLKARPDFLKDNHIMIDVKSTIDASFSGFQKTIVNYNYHIQAALYLDGATEIYGHKFDEFVIIAIEKDPPYAINCFILTDETIAEGRAQYQQALKILKKCRETGIYPGYPEETKPIWLPTWAIKGEENE
jgi:hypothetical protein